MMVWIGYISEAPMKNQSGICCTLNVKVTREAFNYKNEIEFLSSIMYWNEFYEIFNVLKWTLQGKYTFNIYRDFADS